MIDKFYTLKEMPVSERPYEKCERSGPGALSDAELLAVVIRTGARKERAVDLAARILGFSQAYPGLLVLNHISLKELTSIRGIGRVKAIQLLCIAELTKRMAKATNEGKLKLITPESVANYYMEQMRHLTREIVYLVMLDSKSNLLKDMIISSGTVSSSLLSPREIFLNALKYEAVNVILLHNHPSGDPTPSREDIQTTKRIKEAGNLVGVRLMDHIIIGDNKYISLCEQGYM
ncbi:UPF0758 protein YsxA [Anaerocolumna cellulosilytica]|uniref:UPF0758 protein YsxA n=1 Tax=Anaerocolumna cellulosilytica TaxID=433286 RepID=A0A6S6R7V2_9FIRM|nr:DNA repair protein RadC [Anaerocolumna cellulosilytica]MBB5193742.1 DNA repair protein RadC [Anaerocolumna cellulosilytica]BCJ95041.1 UPF0758 protein YsxA [Anaerocolumna cellulosilytica]